MNCFRALMIAAFFSSIVWFGIIKTAYQIGYEDGKAIQMFYANKKFEGCCEITGEIKK